jgi:glucose/arabinose dehydrogenase
VLWTVVNERDMLGDDLVPTTDTRRGRQVLWLAVEYWGKNIDTNVKPQNPKMVAKAIAPTTRSAPIQPRSASPSTRRPRSLFVSGGAFISEHGSWNRSYFTGFKVVWVA